LVASKNKINSKIVLGTAGFAECARQTKTCTLNSQAGTRSAPQYTGVVPTPLHSPDKTLEQYDVAPATGQPENPSRRSAKKRLVKGDKNRKGFLAPVKLTITTNGKQTQGSVSNVYPIAETNFNRHRHVSPLDEQLRNDCVGGKQTLQAVRDH
jgi:hypothetical protein